MCLAFNSNNTQNTAKTTRNRKSKQESGFKQKTDYQSLKTKERSPKSVQWRSFFDEK